MPGNIRNIIFFVKKGETYNNSLQQIHDLLKELLQQKGISANVMIYQSYQTPHDRFIITNNVFIKSGDSFDYFNADGRMKTRGTSLELMPVFNANKAVFNALINKLKDIAGNASDANKCGTRSRGILEMV
jgi:hypothetical protein